MGDVSGTPGSTPGGGTLVYFGMQPANKVDSAFHPFEVDKLSNKL